MNKNLEAVLLQLLDGSDHGRLCHSAALDALAGLMDDIQPGMETWEVRQIFVDALKASSQRLSDLMLAIGEI